MATTGNRRVISNPVPKRLASFGIPLVITQIGEVVEAGEIIEGDIGVEVEAAFETKEEVEEEIVKVALGT